MAVRQASGKQEIGKAVRVAKSTPRVQGLRMLH